MVRPRKGLTAKGGEVTGFEAAAADGHFFPAAARIEGTTVVVTSPFGRRASSGALWLGQQPAVQPV